MARPKPVVANVRTFGNSAGNAKLTCRQTRFCNGVRGMTSISLGPQSDAVVAGVEVAVELAVLVAVVAGEVLADVIWLELIEVVGVAV